VEIVKNCSEVKFGKGSKNLSDNIPAIATKKFFIGVVIIAVSLHVSASTGHPQVNTIYYLVY
jgi:hypothetical protein